MTSLHLLPSLSFHKFVWCLLSDKCSPRPFFMRFLLSLPDRSLAQFLFCLALDFPSNVLSRFFVFFPECSPSLTLTYFPPASLIPLMLDRRFSFSAAPPLFLDFRAFVTVSSPRDLCGLWLFPFLSSQRFFSSPECLFFFTVSDSAASYDYFSPP